jgi:hypothetical protein
MASPLHTGKQPVALPSEAGRVSRIRRDPPPAAKQIEVRDPRQRVRIEAAVGILAFGLAFAVITVALAINWGWSPAQYTIEMKFEE